MSDSWILRDRLDLQRFICELDKLKLCWERPIVATVEPLSQGPSAKQRRRHWSLLNQIAENSWIDGRKFSSESWHRLFMAKFVGQDQLPDGSFCPMSSEALTRAEYADLDEKIVAFAVSELGVEFPHLES